MPYDFHPAVQTVNPFNPAWVQAIGSIVALGIAIWLPMRQDHKMRREKRRAMLAVAEAARKHAEQIIKAIDTTDFRLGVRNVSFYRVYDKSIIDGDLKALREIPLHELGSRDAVLAMRHLTDQVHFFGQSAQAFGDGPLTNLDYIRRVNSLGREDTKSRAEVYEQMLRTLANNVKVHWTEIDASYSALKRPLGL